MSEPEHERIPRLVNELIDPAGLETVGKIDVRIRWHDGALDPLLIKPTASLEASKLPVRAGHGDAGIARIAPAGQASPGGIAGHGGVTARRGAAAPREDQDAWRVRNDIPAHAASAAPG